MTRTILVYRARQFIAWHLYCSGICVFGLGFIFGPALGGLLAAAFGPRVPYIIAGGAAIGTIGSLRSALSHPGRS